jgi:hypothetical protein
VEHGGHFPRAFDETASPAPERRLRLVIHD